MEVEKNQWLQTSITRSAMRVVAPISVTNSAPRTCLNSKGSALYLSVSFKRILLIIMQFGTYESILYKGQTTYVKTFQMVSVYFWFFSQTNVIH